MDFIDKETINKIKNTVNLKELIEEYTELNKSGHNTWIGKCPHPDHNDNNPSFSIKENYWHCFGCDKGGDCIDFIQWIHPNNLSWKESVKYLAKKYDIPINNKFEKDYNRNRLIANKYMKDMNVEALNYIYSRGLSNIDIEKWNIGFDKISKRITFPLFDKNGRIVGFNKRTISNNKNEVKYIHSKNSNIFKKSNYLYGLNYINNKLKYIIITEGVLDVITATKHGLENVVCTLGAALTKDHIPILKSLNKTIIIIYDGDKKGIDSTMKAINLLSENNIDNKIVILPKDTDLAEISLRYKNKLKEYIESKTCTYGYYKIKNIIDDYNKDLYELKLKYQLLINDIYKSIPEKELVAMKSFIENEIGLKASD